MNNKPLLLLLAAIVLSPVNGFTQKPLSESDLLKQIEALNPNRPAQPAQPAQPGLPVQPTQPTQLTVPAPTKSDSGPISLFDPSPTSLTKATDVGKPTDGIKAGTKGKGDKKDPTEITSLEATFDQKANVAVFVGDVVVKDPSFNCWADKVTAFLKHKAAAPAGGAATPQPSTPNPAATAAANQEQKSGGLDKAVAETTSERRVLISQDKTGTDGTVTHSIGKADRAVYDTATGNITLYGNPEVTQGANRMVALTPETTITINRDGQLSSKGQTKSSIVDQAKDNSPGVKPASPQ